MGLLTREQIRGLIKERNMKTTDDISAMLKDLFGDTLQEMFPGRGPAHACDV